MNKVKEFLKNITKRKEMLAAITAGLAVTIVLIIVVAVGCGRSKDSEAAAKNRTTTAAQITTDKEDKTEPENEIVKDETTEDETTAPAMEVYTDDEGNVSAIVSDNGEIINIAEAETSIKADGSTVYEKDGIKVVVDKEGKIEATNSNGDSVVIPIKNTENTTGKNNNSTASASTTKAAEQSTTKKNNSETATTKATEQSTTKKNNTTTSTTKATEQPTTKKQETETTVKETETATEPARELTMEELSRLSAAEVRAQNLSEEKLDALGAYKFGDLSNADNYNKYMQFYTDVKYPNSIYKPGWNFDFNSGNSNYNNNVDMSGNIEIERNNFEYDYFYKNNESVLGPYAAKALLADDADKNNARNEYYTILYNLATTNIDSNAGVAASYLEKKIFSNAASSDGIHTWKYVDTWSASLTDNGTYWIYNAVYFNPKENTVTVVPFRASLGIFNLDWLYQ